MAKAIATDPVSIKEPPKAIDTAKKNSEKSTRKRKKEKGLKAGSNLYSWTLAMLQAKGLATTASYHHHLFSTLQLHQVTNHKGFYC